MNKTCLSPFRNVLNHLQLVFLSKELGEAIIRSRDLFEHLFSQLFWLLDDASYVSARAFRHFEHDRRQFFFQVGLHEASVDARNDFFAQFSRILTFCVYSEGSQFLERWSEAHWSEAGGPNFQNRWAVGRGRLSQSEDINFSQLQTRKPPSQILPKIVIFWDFCFD